MKRHPRNALTVFLVLTGAEWLIYSLFFTVVYVYLATYITDDPFQLVLIETVFTTTILLFEIPTGVVADVYSRRLSVIVGYAMAGIGAIIQGAFQIYEMVLLAQVVWGLGFTFTSGAKDAWIADEIGEERVSHAYMRSSQVGQVAFLIAIPISTALGTIALNIPIILAGALLILLAIYLIAVMPEEGFQRKTEGDRKSWRTMFKTLSEGFQLVRGRTVLIAILLISAVYGLSSAGFDNLWTVNMLENLSFPTIGNFKPVVWFGFLNAVMTILGIVGIEIVRRKVDISGQSGIVRTLMFLTGATAICMVIFGLTRNFWLAGTVYCLSITLRTTSDPIFRTWINQNTSSAVRATILSMDSQVNSLGMIIGGSTIGAIGSAISLPAALVTTGLARIPVTLLFARLVLQGKREQEEILQPRSET
ncbi:MAG: MFS transporter [Anaerolineaceae bacterium]|nr:MAG: MFS transporter [Anaerolineaceae bacterium]